MYTTHQYNMLAEKFFKEEERAEMYLASLQDCQRELALLRNLVKEHGCKQQLPASVGPSNTSGVKTMITKEDLLEDLEKVHSMDHVQHLLNENGNGWNHAACNSREIEKVLRPVFQKLQNNLNNNLRLFLEQEGLKRKEVDF